MHLRLPGPIVAALLAWTLPLPAAAQGRPDAAAPTPLEQAVTEHNCRVPGQAMRSADAYDACLRDQLAWLRTEFGRDLQKLSSAERRAIDQGCSALRVERGRDAYVACLADRLAGLMAKRGRPVPGTEAAAVPAPAVPIAPALEMPPPPVTADPEPHSSALPWLGLLAAAVAGAGAWRLVARRRRPALVLCRVCAEPTTGSDLCAACRHEAAESQRRAAAERAEQHQAVSEAARAAEGQADTGTADTVVMPTPPVRDAAAERVAAEAAEESRRLAREADLQALIRQEHEAARQRDEERRRWQEAAAAAISGDPAGHPHAVLDPHAVLGVGPDATPEQIRAAYDEARGRYAADQVSHLGIELQDLYRTKAQAVERAYEALTGVSPQA